MDMIINATAEAAPPETPAKDAPGTRYTADQAFAAAAEIQEYLDNRLAALRVTKSRAEWIGDHYSVGILAGEIANVEGLSLKAGRVMVFIDPPLGGAAAREGAA